jgi:hypothetical protein
MAYRNSLDALRILLFTPQFGGVISGLSNNGSRLSNGLEYCLVEVTCSTGVQYGIQAYGEEAVDLYQEVIKITRDEIKMLIASKLFSSLR